MDDENDEVVLLDDSGVDMHRIWARTRTAILDHADGDIFVDTDDALEPLHQRIDVVVISKLHL